MLVFSKAKLVLLSVPKTGTTALEAALTRYAAIAVQSPPELKHSPVYRYNRFFRPMIEKFIGEDIEIVASIREPISWLGSWYRYRQRSQLDGQPVSTKGLTFEEFVTGYLADPRPHWANVGAQAKFLEERRNGTSVDRLFRYEDMPSLIAYLQTRLNVEITVPQLNVSPTGDNSLTEQTETSLRKACIEDFQLWETAG